MLCLYIATINYLLNKIFHSTSALFLDEMDNIARSFSLSVDSIFAFAFPAEQDTGL
jgi:hypothetical protein